MNIGKNIIFIILSLVLIITVTRCKNTHTSINNGSDNKKTNDSLTGVFIDTLFYESGKIKTIRHFKNNVLNGEYISFYESGAIKFVCQNSNGRQNGKGVKYFENGNISQIGYSIAGLQYGGAYFYNEEGNYLETYVATDHSQEVFYSADYDSNLNVLSERGEIFSTSFFTSAFGDSIDSRRPLIFKIAIATPPHINVKFYIKDGYKK